MNSGQNNQNLLDFLQSEGPTHTRRVVEHLSISRSTLSRRVRELGDAVLTIGKGRATLLAARHEGISGAIPLNRVQENGRVERIGLLSPIREGERIQWYLESIHAPSAYFEGEFGNGLYPGWPWFLEDLRPSGFLGRAFGKRMARLFTLKENPEEWTDLELLGTLTAFGSNLPGNLILGDGRALADFQDHKIGIREGYYGKSTPETYPQLAARALDEDEDFGSSAGGEQPKFTAMICDKPVEEPRAVMVKFSSKVDTPAGRRWADLLYAEHRANQVLRESGFDTANTRIFEQSDRVFLESERFDRMGPTGRRGLVSLRSMDAAHIGLGAGSWADCARRLLANKWITPEDCERAIRLHCFGELIANTDMHWGNLSFFLPEQRPYPLAPVYDMVPMRFRPSGTGELVERRFKPSLPKPEDQSAWLEMHPIACHYWHQIEADENISDDFRRIAHSAITSLQRLHSILREEES